MPERVGLIGLGTLGGIFGRHLLSAFDDLSVYDLSPQRLSEAVRAGAHAASSARDVGERSDVLVLSLPNPPAVRAALDGPDGVMAGLRPGALIIDISTIDPATAQDMHGAARERDVAYLDAPVSGGAPGEAGMYGAEAATLTFLIGGEEEAFRRALPVLETLGQDFFYFGPAGTGTAVKLISNLCSGLYQLIAAEAYTLGAAIGIPPQHLFEAFKKTDANAYINTEYILPRLLRGEDQPGFSLELQLKDHRLAGELGRAAGVPLFLNGLASQLYQLMVSQGLGGKDIAACVPALAEWAGVNLREPAEDMSRGRGIIHLQRDHDYHG